MFLMVLFCIHFQVVCGKDPRFLHIHTGNAGSVHDSRVFRTCDLKALLESDGRLPSENHLLGDSAYVLQEYMLVPFRQNGHLSPAERAFNYAHSSARVSVEHSIGLPKGKFRRLKYLEMINITEMSYMIFAACVLHNFIIIESGVDEEDIDLSGDDANDEPDQNDDERARSAEGKRVDIANSLL